MALPGVASGAANRSHEVVGRRAVFLDRDGVINRAIVRDGKPYAPQSVAALEILPGVPEALERLRAAGFLNIVVTNQPDVGSGKLPRAVVEAMHAHLQKTLPIDAVKVCYHTDVENCACRKPKPGMILDAARELTIDLGKSYLVGDRWRDVGAAHAAGCRAFFIDCQYAERAPDGPYVPVNSLAEAAQLILRADRSSLGGEIS
jgi:D-glycero-D-manno-heptose 1,7-bisphosphate phosphatase